jgi:4'-phosphopantetheinyl transferase
MNTQKSDTSLIDLHFQRSETLFRSSLCLSAIPFTTLKDLNILHPNEHIYYDSLFVDKRKYSYLLGRYAVKKALHKLLNCKNINDIDVRSTIFNQPIYYSENTAPAYISISHTDSLGACTASQIEHPITIDIEEIDGSQTKNMLKLFTSNEINLIGSSKINSTELATILWSAREALSKILTCGFTASPHVLEVSTVENHDTYTTTTFQHFKQYSCSSFTVDNHILSIVHPKNSILKNTHSLSQLTLRAKAHA